jgi:hypothetical protein
VTSSSTPDGQTKPKSPGRKITVKPANCNNSGEDGDLAGSGHDSSGCYDGGSSSSSRNDGGAHVAAASGGHVCRFCHKVYDKLSRLESHIRSHTGEVSTCDNKWIVVANYDP